MDACTRTKYPSYIRVFAGTSIIFQVLAEGLDSRRNFRMIHKPIWHHLHVNNAAITRFARDECEILAGI